MGDCTSWPDVANSALIVFLILGVLWMLVRFVNKFF